MANNASPALGLEVGDQREQDSRGFVLRWVIATSVGLVTGGAVAAMVEAAIRRSLYGVAMPESEQVLKSMLNVGLMVSVLGAFGASQWLVFRRRLSHSGWWVPAAVAGWGMAGAFSGGLSALFQDVTPNMSDVSAASVAVSLIPFFLMPGVFQWLALRKRFDKRGAVAVVEPWGSLPRACRGFGSGAGRPGDCRLAHPLRLSLRQGLRPVWSRHGANLRSSDGVRDRPPVAAAKTRS